MFGRATIRLGIGPHCSFLYLLCVCYHISGKIKLCYLETIHGKIKVFKSTCK